MPSLSETVDPHVPLGTRSLDALRAECQAQVRRFQQHQDRDSSSCDEILRRAASGDPAALTTLLELSLPFIRQHCPAALRDHVDDVQQLVAERLIRKFRHPESPYQASTFAAYRSYLNLTIHSVSITWLERDHPADSLERLASARGFAPAHATMESMTLRIARLKRCLELLPEDLYREVFRRRIVWGDGVAKVVAALQATHPTLTTQDVYRVTERSIVFLSKLAEVREMFEADGGHD